jgi:hypothetical protein
LSLSLAFALSLRHTLQGIKYFFLRGYELRKLLNLGCLIVLFFIAGNQAGAQSIVTLQGTTGKWADQLPNRTEVISQTIIMIKSGYFGDTKFTFGLNQIPAEDVKFITLKHPSCIDAKTMTIFPTGKIWSSGQKYCVEILPEKTLDLLIDKALSEFDSFFPVWVGELDSTAEANNLSLSPIFLQFQPFAKPSKSPIVFLNSYVQEQIWNVISGANCFGTALSSLTLDSKGPLDLKVPKTVEKFVLSKFQKIDEPTDWQYGDLIMFTIPGDGHAVVYLGHDSLTKLPIVLTKNGYISASVCYLWELKYKRWLR